MVKYARIRDYVKIMNNSRSKHMASLGTMVKAAMGEGRDDRYMILVSHLSDVLL